MKKVNAIYIGALVIGGLLFLFSRSMKTESAFFYGFAENKETEINHIEDVLVDHIHVTNGQEVKKGDLLLVVRDSEVPTKISGLELEKVAISEDTRQKVIDINNKIALLEMKREDKLAEVRNEISELEKKIELRSALYDGLKTIDKQKSTSKTPDEIKLDQLNASILSINESSQKEIQISRRLLTSLGKPSEIKSKIIDSELAHYNKVKDRLSIYAPSDGLIGTITCKEGENISAFSTLINFYKHNPTQVKGYVHESMLLEVTVGDKLEIVSTLHPDRKVLGEVIGLGSRIVEIPERLRKMAEFKTYGREVLIRIPEENRFLQKEKVMLNAAKSDRPGVLSGLFSSKNKVADDRTLNSAKD